MTYGIDFGTSNCVVGRWSTGGAEVVPFDAGNVSADWYGFGGERVFPSVMGVDPAGEAVFGWRAKLRAEHTAEAVKRLLSGHSDVVVGPYRFGSSDVATMLFRALRHGMESAGASIDSAVVTVPAKATGQARVRTRAAARRAGITTLSLINEPTAAAMAYVDMVRDPGVFLVYDWGGGTVDATVLQYADGVLVERAASGRTNLGGIDIDGRLQDLVVARFPGAASWSPLERRRFLLDVERAKITLSTEEETHVLSPDGKHVAEISRRQFEEIVVDLARRSLEPVEEVLADLSLDPDDIDAVIMVGGTSRMPIARRLLTELLKIEPVDQVMLDPLTAVGQGAAFAAAALSGQVDDMISVVTANALGTRVRGEGGAAFSPIIHRNSPLPIKGSRVYRPNAEVVRRIDVDVWEGDPDRALSDPYNQRLVQLDVKFPRPTPRDDARFSLEFTYSEDGTVSARAEILKTGEVLFEGPVSVTHDEASDLGFSEDVDDMFVPARLEAGPTSMPDVQPAPAPEATVPKPGPRGRAMPKPMAASSPDEPAVVLVVDGSNVALAGADKTADATPSAHRLLVALDELLKTYPAADVKVVVDANFRHKVASEEKALVDQFLQSGRWLQPPAGTYGAGDALILAIAQKTMGVVVSNDAYRDFQDAHPWLRDGNRLLGATPVGGSWVFLQRKPPAPRGDGTGRAAVTPPPLPSGWQGSGWAAPENLTAGPRRAMDGFGPVSDNYYMSPLDSK